MRIFIILLSLCGLSGCAATQKETVEKAPERIWYNSQLYAKADAGEISEKQLRHAFVTTKNQCKIQSLQIPIPSPSCTTMPAPDCTGAVGFAAGLCRSQRAYQKCDYSSVDAAYAARTEIFESCMGLDGWALMDVGEIANIEEIAQIETRRNVFQCLDILLAPQGEGDEKIYKGEDITTFIQNLSVKEFNTVAYICYYGDAEELAVLLRYARSRIEESE